TEATQSSYLHGAITLTQSELANPATLASRTISQLTQISHVQEVLRLIQHHDSEVQAGRPMTAEAIARIAGAYERHTGHPVPQETVVQWHDFVRQTLAQHTAPLSGEHLARAEQLHATMTNVAQQPPLVVPSASGAVAALPPHHQEA